MSENDAAELYRKYRPTKLSQVIGQQRAVDIINGMGKSGNVPHVWLFSGQSGVGKTTLARILRKKLKCSGQDFVEINAADERGIELVRGIRRRMGLAPMLGKTRVWLIDECFDGSTLVLAPNGPRMIRSFQKGDLICSLDGEAVVEDVFCNRVELKRIVRLRLSDERSIYTTKQHEFLTSSGWTQAQHLAGMAIIPFRGTEDSNRSGRQRASVEREYITRCQERGMLGKVRVDSVEVYKRGDNEFSFKGIIGDKERRQGFVKFYDLQVDKHPSYFANGVAVHNCHKLTSDAQSAFLKILEDTPQHVYFFLATTDPRKLKRTIITRCTEIGLSPLSVVELEKLVCFVHEQECGASLSSEVTGKIAEVADGSARKALVLLQQVMVESEEEKQLELLAKAATARQSIEICRLFLNPRTRWPEVAQILKGMDDEPEQVRRMILAYMSKVALGAGKAAARAVIVIDVFRDHFYDCGMAGLVSGCWEIVSGDSG